MAYQPQQRNTVSTANSTTSTLGSGAAFTGTSEDILEYSTIQLSVIASHASAADGLSVQQSSDGTNWDIVDTFTISAAVGRTFSFQVAARYYRVVYTNGGTGQSYFRLQTVFHGIPTKASSQRPADATSNENDMEQSSAFLHMFNGTTWDRVRGDTTNGIDVDVTRVIPGTTATALGKAEDAGHTTGDVGVMALGVRANSPTQRTDADADYAPLSLSEVGSQWNSLTPSANGGLSVFTLVSAASTNATNIKASAGNVYGWYIYNSNASARKIAFHNTAGTPTAGSSVLFSIVIPPTSGANVEFTNGIQFGTGIAITTVTGLAANDSAAVAANDLVIAIFYK